MIKKLYTETYGCQMNVYDTQKMTALLKPHGFAPHDTYEDADVVILNTCNIREKAAEKMYCELGRIRDAKQRKKAIGEQMLIVVAGCVAQAEGEEIIKRASCVDIVVGPQSYHNLPELITKVRHERKWVVQLDFTPDEKFDALQAEAQETQSAAAFLSIQEGCDKFCHFCVVPYTRGAEYSRPASDVYKEAVRLAENGVREITLLGQNVSGYHGLATDGQQVSIGQLIRMIAHIDGIERIRYTTSHPNDMTDEELFRVHAEEPKLMPFLHLPIQSGSNRILKAMNRKHDRDFYLRVIERFRQARPDMLFSSDFIVGYPGETEQDLQDTIDIVRQVGYGQCYSFKYSIRPGTPAAILNDQIPEEIKDERLQRLQTELARSQLECNKKMIGLTLPVLFEKPGKRQHQLVGKSPYMQSVVVYGDPSLIGTIQQVSISEAYQNSLHGEIYGTASAA
ncbi:MAG: tRNA (N6-isopentenyl adenosine(37)-C2)-methylthiotransferase MiaB [Proteobacteria bacterium]|nr:tRNA (N6-isopentenyl adenosine(37)-C2)-methylthiotransferase MiaB [Pseudomonadota bacterium]